MSRAIVSQPPPCSPPFIADQKLQHLQIHEQSITRPGFYWDIYDHLEDEETNEDAQGRWSWSDQFADRQLLLEALITEPAFRRTLLINPAGFGKSTFLKWLQYALLKTHPDWLPVFIETKSLVDHEQSNNDRNQFLFEQVKESLIAEWEHENVAIPTQADTLDRWIQHKRRQGKIILLVDAFDEASGKLEAFANLIKQRGTWGRCPLLLSTRPYALRLHKSLIDKAVSWQTLRLLPFNERQIERYLTVPGEPKSRFEYVKENKSLKTVLRNPRVLQYLREASLESLRNGKLETRADILEDALRKAIERSMLLHPQARPLSPDDQGQKISDDEFQLIFQFLATCAFVMVSLRIKNEQGKLAPNFGSISARQFAPEHDGQKLIKVFRDEVWDRVANVCTSQKIIPNKLKFFECLSSLNLGIRSDLLEQGMYGLADTRDGGHFGWQNRGILEFFTAWYMAHHATLDDAQLMWDQNWIYEWDVEETAAYKDCWQDFVDLKSYEAGAWLNTTEILYRPCYEERTGRFYDELPEEIDLDSITCQAKRSPEYIHHTWFRLQELIENGFDRAQRIRDRWLGEFERIAAGEQGSQRAAVALFLKKDFIRLPKGEFWFGNVSQQNLQRIKTNSFHLQRRHVRNDMFRLLAPRHGLRENVEEAYRRDSESPLHPSLYHDWYAAWCYATWCYFDNQSCSLPLEHEYQYAAKISLTPAQQQTWNHWWRENWKKQDGDGLNMTTAQCHGNKTIETGTVIADPVRASEATKVLDSERQGLMDLQGNAWQWCGNRYRAIYSLNVAIKDYQQRHSTSALACIYGGGWYNQPFYLTTHLRDWYAIGFRNHSFSFRLHRAD